MPTIPRLGMDHGHYRWSPLINRRPLRWPGNARIALSVIVNLEHMEWRPPSGAYQSPTLSGGLVPRPFPDYMRFSHREYGHRVGVFRVIDVLDRHGIRPTVAMDAFTADQVVARLVWKSEMAHSSGWLASLKPAASLGGHRRNAPWQSISGMERGRLTAARARWAS
jgi:allantoinase